MFFWDENDAPEEEVEITGVLNLKVMPVSNYKVSLAYGDLTLIVAMIEDYIKGLDVMKEGDIQWECYYRKKFKSISERIQKQIEYDYEAKLKKCLKAKDSKSDIGEDALILALKKQPKMKSDEAEQNDTEQAEG